MPITCYNGTSQGLWGEEGKKPVKNLSSFINVIACYMGYTKNKLEDVDLSLAHFQINVGGP